MVYVIGHGYAFQHQTECLLVILLVKILKHIFWRLRLVAVLETFSTIRVSDITKTLSHDYIFEDVSTEHNTVFMRQRITNHAFELQSDEITMEAFVFGFYSQSASQFTMIRDV